MLRASSGWIKHTKCGRKKLLLGNQGDLFQIVDLEDENALLKQGDLNVTRYFTELKTLWDELEVFRPNLVCRCASPYACNAVIDLRNQKNVDHTIKFLCGLNDQLVAICSQVMLLDLLPSLNKVFSLVIQQELQFSTDVALEACTMSNVAKSVPPQRGFNGCGTSRSNASVPKSRQKPLCSFCGCQNHPVDTCYKKHGYPPSYRSSF